MGKRCRSGHTPVVAFSIMLPHGSITIALTPNETIPQLHAVKTQLKNIFHATRIHSFMPIVSRPTPIPDDNAFNSISPATKPKEKNTFEFPSIEPDP